MHSCYENPFSRAVLESNGIDAGTGLYTFEGVYDSASFQSGASPFLADGGEILVDSSGNPTPQRLEAVRFALSVPVGNPPTTGWPVVIYAHGEGGDFRSFIRDGVARAMALSGLAVISIDQVLNGARNPTAADPVTAFFNVSNPVALRDNVRQGAIDQLQVVQLVKTLTVPGTVTPNGQPIPFEENRIAFMGHSQGGIYGVLAVAFEADLKNAVLAGAGGLNTALLLGKTQPLAFQPLLSTVLGEPSVDVFNNLMALEQLVLEPADPVNYARLVPVGHDVLQIEGITDAYLPPISSEALGVALGANPVMPVLRTIEGFTLLSRSPLQAPVSANSAYGTTAVYVQYAASGFDGHFVVFRVPQVTNTAVQFTYTGLINGRAQLP